MRWMPSLSERRLGGRGGEGMFGWYGEFVSVVSGLEGLVMVMDGVKGEEEEVGMERDGIRWGKSDGVVGRIASGESGNCE